MSRGGGLQGSTYCPNRIYELERVCVRQVPDDAESEISEFQNRADADGGRGRGRGRTESERKWVKTWAMLKKTRIPSSPLNGSKKVGAAKVTQFRREEICRDTDLFSIFFVNRIEDA